MSRTFLSIAGFSLLLATAMGAYAAHGLALEGDARQSLDTAIAYHFYHSIGLIGIVLAGERRGWGALWRVSAAALVAGIVLFCGSVYATVLNGPSLLGGAAPLGGLAFMAGWLAFALAALGTRVRAADGDTSRR